MTIVSDILNKHGISIEDIGKIFGYSNINSFRNSKKNYTKSIEIAEKLVELTEKQILNKWIDHLKS